MRESSSKFWDTSNTLRFNAAFILSSDDLEESLVSPIFVPGVSDKPVWGSVFSSPSEHLDGVSSEHGSGGVLVDSALVAEEIFIDVESDFDGSVGHDFGLDGLDGGSDGVGRLGEVLVVFVLGGVGLGALLGARGGWDLSWAWGVLTGGVVVAWGKGVGFAPFGVGVEVAGNDTGVLVPLPGSSWVSSVASHSAGSAAADHILGRESVLTGLVRGDANSVAHGFDGAESPARSAVSLVTDFLDGVAAWPLDAGVESVGDAISFSLDDWELDADLKGTHLSEDGWFSHV